VFPRYLIRVKCLNHGNLYCILYEPFFAAYIGVGVFLVIVDI
jgi:hypothetical protein